MQYLRPCAAWNGCTALQLLLYSPVIAARLPATTCLCRQHAFHWLHCLCWHVAINTDSTCTVSTCATSADSVKLFLQFIQRRLPLVHLLTVFVVQLMSASVTRVCVGCCFRCWRVGCWQLCCRQNIQFLFTGGSCFCFCWSHGGSYWWWSLLGVWPRQVSSKTVGQWLIIITVWSVVVHVDCRMIHRVHGNVHNRVWIICLHQ